MYSYTSRQPVLMPMSTLSVTAHGGRGAVEIVQARLGAEAVVASWKNVGGATGPEYWKLFGLSAGCVGVGSGL